MNKTELVDAVAQATDLSKVAAGKAVDRGAGCYWQVRSRKEIPWC